MRLILDHPVVLFLIIFAVGAVVTVLLGWIDGWQGGSVGVALTLVSFTGAGLLRFSASDGTRHLVAEPYPGEPLTHRLRPLRRFRRR